ncbi:uncharacterized protein LOC127881061 [Dreissena polymorpha]|nr:uncharacterized protein LOC127881061 [Dreissena polymorpha]
MDAAKTTGGGGRHKFHRASQAPFPALLKGALSKSSSFCVNAPSRPKTDFSATLRKHESFNIVDVHAISDVSKSLRFSDDLNRGVAGKFSGHSTALSSSDWSRYSLYPDVEADFLDNKQGNDIEQSPCPFESKNVTSAHNVDTDPVTRSVIKYNDNKAPTKPVRKNLHTNTVVLGLHDPISKLEDNKVTGANDGSDNKYASHEIIKSKMKSDFEQDRQHEWTRKTENDPEVQESKAWRSHITGVAVVTVPHSPRLRHARVPGDDDVRDTTKRKHDQHVKVKLQSFDVLPNFKKNIRKKRAAGNVTGRNDDVLSDTSSVNTLDLDDTLSASSESLASSPLGHKRTQEDVHNDRKNELRGLNESKKYKSDSMIAQMDKRAKSLDEQPYESVNGTSENKSNIQQKAYTNQHEHFPVESNAGSKIGHAEAPIKPFQMRRQSSQPCLATPSLDDILRDPLATTGVHAHKINQTRSGNDSGEMRFQRSLDSSIYAKSRATGFNLDANVQKGSCGEALLPFVSGPLTDGDIQATDSEDDLISSASEADEILRRRKLNTYFLVLRRRASMALKGDKLNMTNGETRARVVGSFFNVYRCRT